jgi:hypothetical protein
MDPLSPTLSRRERGNRAGLKVHRENENRDRFIFSRKSRKRMNRKRGQIYFLGVIDRCEN